MGGIESKKEKKGLKLSFSKPFIRHVEWPSSLKHAKINSYGIKDAQS